MKFVCMQKGLEFEMIFQKIYHGQIVWQPYPTGGEFRIVIFNERGVWQDYKTTCFIPHKGILS